MREVCVLLLVAAAAANADPVRHVSCNAESYYACGVQVGTQMKEYIQIYAQGDVLVNRLVQWSSTAEGNATLTRYLAANERAYPDYIDEVRGLAAGSGMAFPALLAANLQNELAHFVNHTGEKGCSDYHLLLEGKVQAWGHNEDGESAPANSGTHYFITSNITKPGAPSEAYFAFTYPGQLAGWAWGFNSHGVSQSVNALWVEDTRSSELLGVTFVGRSVLEATSMKDAVQRTQIASQGGGQHFNLGYLYGACTTDDPCQVSVETAPESSGGVDVQVLHGVPGGRYAHFNQYLHTDKAKLGDYYSSVHRLARVAQISTWAKPPSTTDDILRVLSDTEDPEYPLHRSDTSKDPYVTYTTSLFDLRAKSLHIYLSQPVINGTLQPP